jgi:hypothetical protein
MTDPEEHKIDLAVEKIERYIGSKAAVNIPHGVLLAPKQIDQLIVALIGQGFKNAVTTLREAADRAHAEGPYRSLTEWAVYVSAASFLEVEIARAKQYEPCKCRCQLGRHCGGCGHEGCGYKTEV